MVLLFGTCYCSLVIFREVFLRTKFTENPRIKFAQQTLLLVLVTRRFVFLCIAKRVTGHGVDSNEFDFGGFIYGYQS